MLVAGGHGWADMHPTVSRTSEIYDPCTGVWTPSGALNSPRGEGLAMTTLTDGRPVVTGGFWWTVVNPSVNGELPTWSGNRYENTAEVFDPVLGTWTQSPLMARGRSGHFAVALTDNSLLVAGGFQAGTLGRRFV